MLKSFYHTGFVVHDLETSVKFYTEVLGLEVVRRMEREGPFIEQVLGFEQAHIIGAFLSMAYGHSLELIQYLVPPSGHGKVERNDLGATHLAFWVSNIEECHARMSERGLKFISPPASFVQDGVVVRKAAYAQDPDGNWLEFVEALE